jgi:hypothetical protein
MTNPRPATMRAGTARNHPSSVRKTPKNDESDDEPDHGSYPTDDDHCNEHQDVYCQSEKSLCEAPHALSSLRTATGLGKPAILHNSATLASLRARRIPHMAIFSSLVALANMPGGYFWRRTSENFPRRWVNSAELRPDCPGTPARGRPYRRVLSFLCSG